MKSWPRLSSVLLAVSTGVLLGVPVGGQEPVPPVQTATGSAAAPAAERVAPAPVMQEEQWELHVEELREGLLSGEQGTDEAELLFGKLEAVLAGKRQELRVALAAVERDVDHEETLALHRTLHALYDVRLALLELVSPEFRARVLGMGRTGKRALKAEVDHVALYPWCSVYGSTGRAPDCQVCEPGCWR